MASPKSKRQSRRTNGSPSSSTPGGAASSAAIGPNQGSWNGTASLLQGNSSFPLSGESDEGGLPRIPTRKNGCAKITKAMENLHLRVGIASRVAQRPELPLYPPAKDLLRKTTDLTGKGQHGRQCR